MAGRTLQGLALQVALEHALHCESLHNLPSDVQMRLWEELSVMVPITAALLRNFDLPLLLAANKTLGGARGLHRDALELLGQHEKEEQRVNAAHVGLRSLRVSAVHPKPQGMQGLLAPFHQLRSLSLHVFIKPTDLRCLRGMPQLRRLDLSRSSLCNQGMPHLAIPSLEELSLAECTMATDAGLLALIKKKGVLTKLRVLDIARTKFTPVALIKVSELASLVAINAACTDLDDPAFLSWSQVLRLTHLNLHATRITGASFRHIIGMKHLRYLDLSGIFSGNQCSHHEVLAAPRLEYANLSYTLPSSGRWRQGNIRQLSRHLRVVVDTKPINGRVRTRCSALHPYSKALYLTPCPNLQLLPQNTHRLDARARPCDTSAVCQVLAKGVRDGDDDLIDEAVHVLIRSLAPSVDRYDHSQFEGFLAAQTNDKFGGMRRRESRERKMTAVPRKPQFADKTERYQYFQHKAATGRQLLEHFLRVYDHRASPASAWLLPRRLNFELHLFRRAHLDYFRLRRHCRLVCDGPTQLAHHVLSANLCNLSPDNSNELTKNVMACLTATFTRLRAHHSGSGTEAKASASLNLNNLVQCREVDSVKRSVRLLARLVALANASDQVRLIEIIVDSGGLRLVVDVMWHLGLADDDAALCLVCLQIVAGLVAYEPPPAHLLPRQLRGQVATSQGLRSDPDAKARFPARAQEQLAANRLWQSRLCKAALLFGDTEPIIGEHVLRSFPIKLESLSVSGLGQLVISNLANYVRELSAPCRHTDWFAPFISSFVLQRLVKPLLESTTAPDAAAKSRPPPYAPPSFHGIGTENALQLVLAAALRSARAAAGLGRAVWARERQAEEAHADSVAQVWAKLALNDVRKPEPNFWVPACTPLTAVGTTDNDDCVAPSTSGVDAAVAEVCDRFVAAFVEAGGVALLVEVVERECAETQTTARCDRRRIALTLARAEERLRARCPTATPNWEWYELQLRWERQRKIAGLAAALLRTLVSATRDNDDEDGEDDEGEMKIERHDDESTIAQLTSIEPGAGMDRLLARARSLHASGRAGAAEWEDDVGLRPFLELRRAKKANEAHNRLRRLKRNQDARNGRNEC